MYTDQAKIAAYLGRDLTESEVSIIGSVIAGVTAYIDSFTGTSWAVGAAGTEKIYQAERGEFIFIDPVQNITAVHLLDDAMEVAETLESTAYRAYPLNEDTKTYLKIIAGYSVTTYIDSDTTWGRRYIKVVGTFGQAPAVPSDISLAATIMASRYLNAGSQNLKSESLEGYSRVFADPALQDGQVTMILNGKRQVYL